MSDVVRSERICGFNCNQINRRMLLKSLMLGTLASAIPSSSLFARDGLKWDVTFKGFTKEQRSLINESIGLLIKSMNSDRITGSGEDGFSDQLSNATPMVEDAYIRRAYSSAQFKKVHERKMIREKDRDSEKYRLLSSQVILIWKFGIPITIKEFEEDSKTWGRAYVGTVVTHDLEEDRDDAFEGKFEIQLNTHHLGQGGWGNNPSTWAGVIIHEVLHNLGHSHGENEYGNHLQINAYQAAISSNWGEKRTTQGTLSKSIFGDTSTYSKFVEQPPKIGCGLMKDK